MEPKVSLDTFGAFERSNMVAKLALALIALVIIVVAVMGLAFWYFNQRDERQHEMEKRRMDQTDTIVEMAEDDEL